MIERTPKDIPILFSAPMVQALLGDRKTMTRRLAWADRKVRGEENLKERVPSPWTKVSPGDLLWVRETWQDVHPCAIEKGRASVECTAGIPGPPHVDYMTIFRADGEYRPVHFINEYPYRALCEENCAADHMHEHHGWQSPLHLKRYKSRLTLEVIGVKRERLQDISSIDAEREGVRCDMSQWGFVDHFKALWERLHGAGSWDSNPEVVALAFTVHKQNIDAFKAGRCSP